MTNPTIWNQILIWPITNLLVLFYKGFELLHIPGPLGFAIIILTLVIRLILYPLMQKQLTSAKHMADLKPQLDALAAKHKDDKKGLQQAQLAFYKEQGVNPAAGCLPTLIQFPIMIALYNVLYSVLGNGELTKFISDINTIVYAPWMKLTTLDVSFFGLNLAVKPSEWQKYGWWLLLIPLLTGLLQWYQTRLMLPAKKTIKDDITKPTKKQEVMKTDETKETKSDTMADMQKQMALITPVMFGFFALQFPVGLALYWNVFGLFGIMQQLHVNKQTKK